MELTLVIFGRFLHRQCSITDTELERNPSLVNLKYTNNIRKLPSNTRTVFTHTRTFKKYKKDAKQSSLSGLPSNIANDCPSGKPTLSLPTSLDTCSRDVPLGTTLDVLLKILHALFVFLLRLR